MGAKGKDGIFRYADSWDMWLMLFGTLGSIGDGLQNPLMMFILSDVINDYGSGKELTNEVVNKVSMLIIFFSCNLILTMVTRIALHEASIAATTWGLWHFS